jgi:hypothetical protein
MSLRWFKVTGGDLATWAATLRAIADEMEQAGSACDGTTASDSTAAHASPAR